MRRLLCVALSLGALPAAAFEVPVDGGQLGLFAGLGPSQPVDNQGLIGGWFAVGGDRWRLELSGTWQDGLARRRTVGAFVIDQGLLPPDDPIADRAAWTGEVLVRAVQLAGKFATLQSAQTAFWLTLGGGGGVRALVDADAQTHLAPTALGSVALDVGLGSILRLRLDARGFAALRRDQTVGLGAEFIVGLGGRLWSR